MREAVIKQLDIWTEIYTHQRPEDESDLFGYNVEGVAMFVKQLAVNCEDMELLGKATRLELHIERKRRENRLAEEEQEQQTAHEFDFYKKVRKLCIKYFYHEPSFVIDMSKYRILVNKYATSFSDDKALARLKKYIDEKHILDTIYAGVRDSVGFTFFDMGRMPEFEDIKDAFTRSLHDVYRRADAHVVKIIAKHTDIHLAQITSELQAKN
jgi:UTP:GlnB (protein PII) uridylyltransferase